MNPKRFLVLFLLLLSPACGSVVANPHPPAAATVAPPLAKKVPKELVLHGERRTDDYFWLREKTNPDVVAYLQAENDYTASVMRATEPLQEVLYREMVGRIQETDLSVPFEDDGWFYYSRTVEGKQYPIQCRKKGSLEAPEEIVLELNQMAEGLEYLGLGAFEVSDDGNLLAYSLDTTGFRQYTLHFKDLRTGQVLPDRIEKTGSVAWAADGRTVFYTVEDPAKRQYRLHRHRLGETSDPLVHEETDERFELSVERSRSEAYLFLSSNSHTTSEVRFLAAAEPEGAWTIVQARTPEHEYEVDHRGERFYVRTNDRGRNFRVVTAPVAEPGQAHWEELLAHRSEVMLENLDVFANELVLWEREGGVPQARITDLATGEAHRVAFPEPVYSVSPTGNAEFETTRLRYRYTSLVTPSSVFDYDMDTRRATLLKETPVLGGFDRANYASERLQATAPDGVKVPISLVYKKGVPLDGTSPLLLNGYGSYGFPYPVRFDSNALSLLDRGVIVAIAHIRGGGELGKAWHDDGRMMRKKNTFTDFIAAAEHLIAQRYTSPERLAIQGGSAGGLLMGAVVNLRPDLFRAVISHVPFVDVINTMSDPSLPLTVGEFEEWGDPARKDEYEYLASYCPYTNLERQAYPTLLVRTSLNDSQVMYWEPAKYVAKLRTLKTDGNPLLLQTNMAAGHGGSSGRYDSLREDAFDDAFLLTQLGVELVATP